MHIFGKEARLLSLRFIAKDDSILPDAFHFVCNDSYLINEIFFQILV